MNKVGQVAEAGRPKLRVTQYTSEYRGHVLEMNYYWGAWFWMRPCLHAQHEAYPTPEAALAAAVAWVDAQEGKP